LSRKTKIQATTTISSCSRVKAATVTGPDRLENHAIGVAFAERNRSIPKLGFGDLDLGFRVS
jgi:hypothetical protein